MRASQRNAFPKDPPRTSETSGELIKMLWFSSSCIGPSYVPPSLRTPPAKPEAIPMPVSAKELLQLGSPLQFHLLGYPDPNSVIVTGMTLSSASDCSNRDCIPSGPVVSVASSTRTEAGKARQTRLFPARSRLDLADAWGDQPTGDVSGW